MDWRLQLISMKSELRVIVDQHATVNDPSFTCSATSQARWGNARRRSSRIDRAYAGMRPWQRGGMKPSGQCRRHKASKEASPSLGCVPMVSGSEPTYLRPREKSPWEPLLITHGR